MQKKASEIRGSSLFATTRCITLENLSLLIICNNRLITKILQHMFEMCAGYDKKCSVYFEMCAGHE